MPVFSECGEAAADEVAVKYQSALAAKADSEREIEKGIKEIKVSRFSGVNRFFRNLARRGVL